MLKKIKSLLSLEKLFQGLLHKGFITILTIIVAYSYSQFLKLKHEVSKIQFAMHSQSKDYAVRFTISLNELHARLKSLIENNCDKGV